MISLVLGGLTGLALALAAPSLSAATDPDFPCVQVLVPRLSPGQIWSGPPIDAIDPDAWKADPEVARLVGMAADRQLPTPDLLKEVERFAAAIRSEAGTDAEARLTLLFSGIFETLQTRRSAAIEAVHRYARSQRALLDRIAGHLRTLEALPPDDPEHARLTEALHWDRRILDDRRRLLPTLCETPGEIERRLGAVARILAAQLEIR